MVRFRYSRISFAAYIIINFEQVATVINISIMLMYDYTIQIVYTIQIHKMLSNNIPKNDLPKI